MDKESTHTGEKAAADTDKKDKGDDKTTETFVSKSGEDDLILSVEGRKIYVCRAVLCVASSVFQAMFKSDFREKGQQEIVLPGKIYEDFVEFVYCFYPDKLKHVTDENVYRILPYVVEYQVKVLEERCEKELIHLLIDRHTTDANEIYRHLYLSEMYNLEDLKTKCISVASSLLVAEMDEGSSAYQISDKSVLQIRYLALQRKELDQKDDMTVFASQCSIHVHKTSYSSTALASGENIIKFNMNVGQSSDIGNLLRAIRLCIRYYKNDKEQLSKFISYLNAKSREELLYVTIDEELDLLPEAVKQSVTITKK